MSPDPVFVTHNRIELAVHELRSGDGAKLLLLHALGEQTPAVVPAHLERWPGPVWGLDFTGHGQSSVAVGGGYFAEILMGDVDAAIELLGPVTVYGRGLGAYIALLIAGARPTDVRGAILADGPGILGGGPEPGSPVVTQLVTDGSTPDPYAIAELSRDVRPPDYALTFAHQAIELGELDTAFAVVAKNRPAWLAALVREPGVTECTLDEALALFS